MTSLNGHKVKVWFYNACYWTATILTIPIILPLYILYQLGEPSARLGECIQSITIGPFSERLHKLERDAALKARQVPHDH